MKTMTQPKAMAAKGMGGAMRLVAAVGRAVVVMVRNIHET